MAFLVMAIGFVLLAAFVFFNGTLTTASSSGLWLALGLGVAYGLGGVGIFKAFSMGPVSLVAPLTSAYPVLVFLWGIVHGLEPSLLQWGATVVAIGGAALVARSGDKTSGIDSVEKEKLPILIFYCVIASAGYAAAIILGQNAAAAMGEVEATWVSRPAAMLAILPFLARERAPPKLSLPHWNGIFLIAALDVLAVVAVIAAGRLPGREFAAIGVSAYGAIAVIFAMVFLKEKVSWRQWAGIILIVAGVATLSVSE